MADNLTEMTTGIVAAYLHATRVSISEIPALITTVAGALRAAGGGVEPVIELDNRRTSREIRNSYTRDAITSFIDGKSYRAIKRHLAAHGMTPAEYRTRFGLPHDYPMVAASYSEARSAMSKALGLGRKPGAKKRAPRRVKA